jgi:hypothetical protein
MCVNANDPDLMEGAVCAVRVCSVRRKVLARPCGHPICPKHWKRGAGTCIVCRPPREVPMPKAEPHETLVTFERRDHRPASERWWAFVNLRAEVAHGEGEDVLVRVGLGVAATPDEAERQARFDAVGRLLATADALEAK